VAPRRQEGRLEVLLQAAQSAAGKKVALEVTTTYKNAFGQKKTVAAKAVLGTSAKVAT
jgi:hypothetical protein